MTLQEMRPMPKLFTAHNSICTQKVFLTLIEKGLCWELEYIDLFKNEQYRPEYLKLNPKGVVPTLIHEGHTIVEFESFASTSIRHSRSRLSFPLPPSNARRCGAGVSTSTKGFSRPREK